MKTAATTSADQGEFSNIEEITVWFGNSLLWSLLYIYISSWEWPRYPEHQGTNHLFQPPQVGSETIFIQCSPGPGQPPWQWNINYHLMPYWSSAVFQDGTWWPSYHRLDRLDRDSELEIVCSSHLWSDGNFNHKQQDQFDPLENFGVVCRLIYIYLLHKEIHHFGKFYDCLSILLKCSW